MPNKIIKKEIIEPEKENNSVKIIEIPPPKPLIELTPEMIAKYDAIESLRKWKKWSIQHPDEHLLEKLDEKALDEEIQKQPQKIISTFGEDIPKITPLESDSYQFPYHYSVKAKLGIGKDNYRTFGVHLPNYYNVKSLSDRHIIYQYLLAEYESVGDEDFENEIYHFGFNNIEAMLLIAPGGIREKWKESRIF